MKIREVTIEYILFDNGSKITYDHCTDCCEYNYADFEQLDDLAMAHDYDPQSMKFEVVKYCGFRFGDNRRMFFVPCYSEQNGYYSSDIQIYYNGEQVLSFDAETVYID